MPPLDGTPESIQKLEAKHGAKLRELRAIHDKALAEDRDLTEEEQRAYETVEGELDALETRLDRAKKIEARAAKTARPATTEQKASEPTKRPYGALSVNWQQKDPATLFARQAIAMYRAGNNRMFAAQFAKEEMGDEVLAHFLSVGPEMVLRAAVDGMSTTDPASAAPLVQVREAAEMFFEMLRPKSVFAGLAGLELNFDRDGALKVPRQTSGASGGWVGEGGAIPVGKLEFGTVSLSPKKVAVIAFASQELMDHSTPSAEALITDDLVRGAATTIDATFVDDNAATTARPAGIRTFDASPTAADATGTTTLERVIADVKAAKAAMAAAMIPMERCVWVMSESTRIALELVQDSVGQIAFPEVERGMFRGYKIVSSSTMGDQLILLDAAFFVKAFDKAPVIDSSSDATIHADSAPVANLGDGDGLGTGIAASPMVSMFQTDQVAVRMRQRLDWTVRQAGAVQVVTGVAY